MTDPKFIKRKKSNNKRALFLVMILIIAIFLFYNIEDLLEGLFTKK
ncbi:MAG: hypothetical protein L3J08_07425 [Flavobacteriaceae bacterium]|nr:hypothetical protein [Flavobacteriaceae bacterium]